MAGVVGSI